MLRALRSLPPRQRAVLVVRHYLDRTEHQTAELLPYLGADFPTCSPAAVSRFGTTTSFGAFG